MLPEKQCALKNTSPRKISSNWMSCYDKEFSLIWGKLPKPLNKILVSFAIFTFGIAVSGDWVNLWIHISRQLGFNIKKQSVIDNNQHWSFESIGLKSFWIYFISANLVSYAIFFTVGGFLQWYFYIRQKDHPETWKCQPTRFLTPELERNEFFLGCLTLFFNGTGSSILACYIANGGYSTVYYEFFEYGWAWFFLQFPVTFIYEDYITYWMHRFLHTPWLYKHFHKLHHAYKQPTVWSVTAIHPIESVFMQCVLVTPLFLYPIHWLSFYSIAMYLFYHGIRDHSGINFKSYWWQPWQPDTIFHDNHHQYFHVNFGFNMKYWDKLHGTSRQVDRIYNENIFYGKGKSLKKATKQERRQYLEEKKAENPLAYLKEDR